MAHGYDVRQCVMLVIFMLTSHSNSLVVTKKPCVGDDCADGKNGTSDKTDDMDIKYGLVPIFLIGASSVIIIYIVMHCLYLHCYAKRKMQRMASKNQAATTTILLNDGQTSSNLQPVTPIVKYEAPYGKTEVMQTTPFLVEKQNNLEVSNKSKKTISKRSSLKNILNNMSPKSNDKKPSISSYQEGMSEMIPPAGRQASICFVPMGQPMNDPSGSSNKWTLLQGFVYSHIHLSSNGTYSIPCATHTVTDTNGSHKHQGTIYVPSSDVVTNSDAFDYVPDTTNHQPSEDCDVTDDIVDSGSEREDNEFATMDESDTNQPEVEHATPPVPETSQRSAIQLSAEIHHTNHEHQ